MTLSPPPYSLAENLAAASVYSADTAVLTQSDIEMAESEERTWSPE
jgi:hypothetical protein